MNALVSGGTGFIGSALVKSLQAPRIFTRNPKKAKSLGISPSQCFRWEPASGPPPKEAFEKIDTVFHLLGENVGSGRWTKSKKKAIFESRVLSTRHLVKQMEKLNQRPRTFLCSSAIGFYPDCKDEMIDEQTSPGDGFLSEVCQQWEAEAKKAESLGMRVVNVRMGVVLGARGGPLHKMLPPFKLGLGGKLGSGKQWMAWIHLDDAVGIYLHAATTPSIRGPINAVSPVPVTNIEFTQTLAKRLKRPAIFPVPAIGLKLAIGEFANVILESQRIVPRVAQSSGYVFKFPTLKDALENILHEENGS